MSTGLSTGTTLRHATAAMAGAEPIVLGRVTDRAEWDALVAACPTPQLPQSFAYGEGKRAKGWTVLRVSFSERGRIVAIASILEYRRLGLRLLSRVNRGPLFLDPSPPDERVVAVYRALRRRRGPLLIAPMLMQGEASAALLHRAGFHLRQASGWQSGTIDLRRDLAAIEAGFTAPFRNRARIAAKAGATLRISSDEASFEWMLARHAENMRDKGFNAADATLLRALRAAAPEDVRVFQLWFEGEPVAGMSVVRFGHRAEYHIGWFGPAGRKLNAGNFLMTAILHELHAGGVAEFDVGGLKPGDGYTRFKRTMRPDEYALAGEWMAF